MVGKVRAWRNPARLSSTLSDRASHGTPVLGRILGRRGRGAGGLHRPVALFPRLQEDNRTAAEGAYSLDTAYLP